MAIISALPASTSAVINSTTDFTMPNLVNVVGTPTVTAVEYRRVIQSIVFYNRETGVSEETEYRVLFGGRTVFQFKLKQNESFTIEDLKMTQLGDVTGSTNNDATKIRCEVISTGKTLGANVVISFATITITG
jgi:hypothetical protein